MRLLKFLSSIMLLLWLSACSNSEAPPLRLGTNVWPGYEPLYLARQQGFLNENKVRLIEFSSSTQTIQAFRNNLIDAAALTLDEVLLLQESEDDIRIILVMDISNGADVIIAQPGINKLQDLKGKRIGVEGDALGAYVISRVLELAKIGKQSIHIVQLEISKQEKAFRNKSVDAVVTFEPIRSKLLKIGGKQIFDSSQIPGEIVDVLVVQNSYLKQYPENLKYLLKSWYRALAMIKAQPLESAKILGLRMQLNAQDTLNAYQGLVLPDKNRNKQLLNPDNPELLKTVKKLSDIMLKEKLISHSVNPELLFKKEY